MKKAILLGAAFVLAACTRGSETATTSPPGPGGPTPSASPGASASAAAIPAVARVDSARLKDPRWQRAGGEDPADRQALADALGATGLVEALDDGGEIARTALSALPLADDAELSLGPLARRALAASGDDLGAILEAILAIAGRPAGAREALDPEGAAEAGEAMIALAGRTSLPREHRALAVSAARALAEKKIVDPARIPRDLDPP
ncbi:thiamine biosynthesis protein [Polyangium aurulentum]|uniref:thiamine biosynthesis protein n=1 Tax=Polyangium aurulentum TaxID=2567896 RepID=UPI0010ADC30D|nr:thiamine biosynthesis protein [Polyangium aurulentum]UQA58078.1 thiamine biosynthesis protein [Polyangium aurulentum]